MSAVELIGVKIRYANEKALEMRVWKLLLVLEINKNIDLNKQG